MEFHDRKVCAVCCSMLKHIYTIENMPVKLCCSDIPNVHSCPMSFSLCNYCKTIQLDKLIPLDILYSGNHNTSVVGKTWENYFQFICSIISPFLLYPYKFVFAIFFNYSHIRTCN